MQIPNFLALAGSNPGVRGAMHGMDLVHSAQQNRYLPDMLRAELEQRLLGNQKSQAELPFVGPQAEANLFGRQFENERLQKLMPFLAPTAQTTLDSLRADLTKKQLALAYASSPEGKRKAQMELEEAEEKLRKLRLENEYYPKKTETEIGKDMRGTVPQRTFDWLFGAQPTGFERTPEQTEATKNIWSRMFGQKEGEKPRSIVDMMRGKKAAPPEPGMVMVDVDGKQFWVDSHSLNEIRKDHPTMREI